MNSIIAILLVACVGAPASVAAAAAQQPERTVTASLTKPTFEVCLNAADAAAAERFFTDDLGLTARPEPLGLRGGRDADADLRRRRHRRWNPANPLEGVRHGLRGCRSIVPSPFTEEAGRVRYFCGFDQTGPTGRDGAKGPMAWVYRGNLKEKP
jgi:hypothetical protein